MKIFVVYAAAEGRTPEPMFAFHAQSLDEAQTMKDRWARYHGMQPSEYGVEENPKFRESGCSMHDDYVDHYGYQRLKSLCFYYYQSPEDKRPLPVECHVVAKKPTEAEIRSLLSEVAGQQFDHHPFKIWTGMSSTDSTKPLCGLAAEDREDGRFIVPTLEISRR